MKLNSNMGKKQQFIFNFIDCETHDDSLPEEIPPKCKKKKE